MSSLVANVIIADTISANNLAGGNSSFIITANSTQISAISVDGSNLSINSTVIFMGNTTANLIINATTTSTDQVVVNGVTYTSASMSAVANTVDYQAFTANGTWTKPAWATSTDLVTIMMWGGGGGGNTTGGSGGGGACVIVHKPAGECNATCTVVVGTGGTASVVGGDSSFSPNSTFTITAYGGGNANATFGGGGGGWFSAGSVGTSGGPLGGAAGNVTAASVSTASTFGGGGAGNTAAANGAASIWGGGGGGVTTGVGGASIYGGGGGSGTGAAGISRFGGNGANSSTTAGAPGGGGAGNTTNVTGARGEVRVWVQGLVE